VLRDVDHLLMLKGGVPALMRSRTDLTRELSSTAEEPVRLATAR